MICWETVSTVIFPTYNRLLSDFLKKKQLIFIQSFRGLDFHNLFLSS